MGQRILRRRAVADRTGLSTTQLWRLERDGAFPARVKLGVQAVGWREHEVDAWIEARVRGGCPRPGIALAAASGARKAAAEKEPGRKALRAADH